MCGQDCTSSGDSREESVPFFELLAAAHIPWIVVSTPEQLNRMVCVVIKVPHSACFLFLFLFATARANSNLHFTGPLNIQVKSTNLYWPPIVMSSLLIKI